MNQTQLKYARERAASIKRRREEKLNESYNGSKMTNDKKAEAVKSGRFEVIGAGYHWYDRIVFLDDVRGMTEDAYKKAFGDLKVEYDKLIDELVLGDNEQALALLKAFEAAASE